MGVVNNDDNLWHAHCYTVGVSVNITLRLLLSEWQPNTPRRAMLWYR